MIFGGIANASTGCEQGMDENGLMKKKKKKNEDS